MGEPVSSQGIALAALIGLAVVTVILGRLIAGLRREGSQVFTTAFGRADLFMALGLAGFFGVLVALAVGHPEPAQPMTVGKVAASAMTFAAIVFALCAFLSYRRIPLVETFGFTRLAGPRVLGTALWLLLGAFPLVGLTSLLAQQWLKDDASEQELVTLFRSAAGHGDHGMMAAVFLTGVILAPVCEELLFRGYFYAVGKRFAGPWISGAVTSLVFAAFHGNLASLPSLFALAVMLTLAYERTGSLAVPMTMHALFNGTSLGILYLQATGQLAI